MKAPLNENVERFIANRKNADLLVGASIEAEKSDRPVAFTFDENSGRIRLVTLSSSNSETKGKKKTILTCRPR